MLPPEFDDTQSPPVPSNLELMVGNTTWTSYTVIVTVVVYVIVVTTECSLLSSMMSILPCQVT